MFADQLDALRQVLWGAPLLVLLLGTGVFLTLRTRGLALRNLVPALKLALGRDSRKSGGSVSPFAALMTTLAATIGTGNIVGVAAALTAGGPGALVWMQLSALVGLTLKYAECTLAVKFRRPGEHSGGPMAVMERGIRPRWLGRFLGSLFAAFTVLASFGVGDMTQSNSMATALRTATGIPVHLIGAFTAILTLLITAGGLQRISRAASVLVPFMAGGYLLAGSAVIWANRAGLPEAIGLMLHQALSPRAFLSGAAGQAIRVGVTRGVFSNEAGMGSSAITAASASGDDPSVHGYINMTGVFFDTTVICTITGRAICCSGVLGTLDPATGLPADGAALTILAFQSVLGSRSGTFLAVSIALFAFSSMLGWAYQGEMALAYLAGGRAIPLYRVCFALAAWWGAVEELATVFCLSDIANALMAVPNLICLLLLSGVVKQEMERFQRTHFARNRTKKL